MDGLPDVCFARETFVPQPDQIRDSDAHDLADVLDIAGAKIEIRVFQPAPGPGRRTCFPRAGMQLPSGSHPRELLWHGYVRYDEDSDFPVWAKVRITANMTRVVAAANISSRQADSEQPGPLGKLRGFSAG